MNISERRAWLETPAGQVHATFGITDAVDYDRAEAMVDEVRKHHLRAYGRPLSDRELEVARMGAEARSLVPVAVDVPVTAAQLVERVNSATVNAGWSYVPEFRGQHSGMATLQDGQWVGDPNVVERVQAAEADRAARDAAESESWRNGPLVLRTVGRASR